MEASREPTVLNGKSGFSFRNSPDKGQHVLEEGLSEERPSPEILAIYLKHLGIYKGRKRRRCLSRELNKIAFL